jgi:hypothetical protein
VIVASRTFLIALAVAVSLPACRATSSRFVPSGDAVGAGPEGQSAAFYQYVSPDPRKGQVQVWCDGRRDGALQLGLRVRNDSAAPIVFSPSESTLRYPDMDPDMTPRERTDVSVAAGGASDVALHFPFPQRYENRLPAEVTLAWVLKAGGKTFRESTTFSVETGRGFVPRPLSSDGEPLDREDTDRPRGASPVGIPVGPDASPDR